MIKIIKDTKIDGTKIIVPKVYKDLRGTFFESFNKNDFKQARLPTQFVQDNQASSVQGTLRGLHYQLKFPQGKLVRVIKGEVFDVAVDIRKKSPTFKQYTGIRLSEKNKKIMYLPAGLAHGYLVLSETAIFQYKCTEHYHPDDEYGIKWSDENLNINWPIKNPILSTKDLKLPTLKTINPDHLPDY